VDIHSTKLITFDYYQIRVTPMALSRTWGQRSRSCNDFQRDLV